MTRSSFSFATLLAVVLASTPTFADPEKDSAKIIAAADWSKMETVTVILSEHAFSPSTIAFREGTPTKLVLRNEGKQHHYFTSATFFKSIATRKVQGSDGEVKAPYLTAVEVYAGKSLEIYFVPPEKGTWEVVCTMTGHAEQGMKGTITVK